MLLLLLLSQGDLFQELPCLVSFIPGLQSLENEVVICIGKKIICMRLKCYKAAKAMLPLIKKYRCDLRFITRL